MLKPKEVKEIEHELSIMPRRDAAGVEALKVVQRHRGWVSDEALKEVAAYLDMSPEALDGVATFYNLVYRQPVGRHVILLCDSISCWITGCDRIRDALSDRLGIGFGQTGPDGRFTLLPMPCLGTCDHAPALMIDEDLHRDLDPEKLDEILERYE